MNTTGKRVNFASIQHSHGVQAPGYKALPYRTGYEEVIASKVSNLFATSAKDDGVVKQVKDNGITVKYKNGDEIVYKLGIRHGTVTGIYIPHTLTTKMKAGDKFTKGDILVYNSGFFTASEMNPNNVVYKGGILAKIALADCADTIEDGCTISEKLAKQLVTPSTTLYGLILDFNNNVHNLVKIGDALKPDDILCTIEENLDGSGERDNEAIMALNQLAKTTPKSKVYGKVTNIEVIYFGKTGHMTENLQSLVDEYDKRRAKHVKLYSLEDAKTGQIDESIRVSGKKLVKNQLAINIYVDGEITMGDGDKLVFGNCLKTTVSRVETNPVIAEDGTEVDGAYSYTGVSDRIIQSPEIAGIANTVLIEMSKQMGKLFIGG